MTGLKLAKPLISFISALILIIIPLQTVSAQNASADKNSDIVPPVAAPSPKEASVTTDMVDMKPEFYKEYKKCIDHIREPQVLNMLDELNKKAVKANDKLTQVCVLCQKAMHYYFTEASHDSLREATKRVQKFAYENKMPRYYFWIWMRYAEYYVKMRQYNLALIELDAMEKEARELDCPEGIIDAYRVMARIYYIKKNHALAKELLQKAINMVLEYKDAERFDLSDMYSRLAAYQIENKEYFAARQSLDKAAAEVRTSHQRLMMLKQWASLYMALKDKEKLKETLAQIRKIDDYQTEYVLTHTELDLASLQKDYALLERLLPVMREKRYIAEDDYLRKMAETLSNIPGKEKESLEFYKRYTVFCDSLNLNESNGRVEEFSAILNVQKSVLDNKQVEVNMEAEKTKSLLICLSGCAVLVLILLIILYLQMKRSASLARKVSSMADEGKAEDNESEIKHGK